MHSERVLSMLLRAQSRFSNKARVSFRASLLASVHCLMISWTWPGRKNDGGRVQEAGLAHSKCPQFTWCRSRMGVPSQPRTAESCDRYSQVPLLFPDLQHAASGGPSSSSMRVSIAVTRSSSSSIEIPFIFHCRSHRKRFESYQRSSIP